MPLACVAAERVRPLDGPLPVAGDVEVEVAVAVVIEEGGPRRPGGPSAAEASFGLAERAVAVVEVQDVGAEVGQEEVGEAVVVHVAGGHAVAEPPVADAGPVGDVLEGAVAPVAIEPVAPRGLVGASSGKLRVVAK